MLSEAPSAARRTSAFLVAIPIALVAVLLAPASASAAEVERYRFNGVIVTGYDQRADEGDPCVITVRSVTASKNLVMFYSQVYNECAGGSGGEEQIIATGSRCTDVLRHSGHQGRSRHRHGPLVRRHHGRFRRQRSAGRRLDRRRTRGAGPHPLYDLAPGSYRFSYRTSGTVAPATVTVTVPFETHATIGKYIEMRLSITN